MYAILIVLVNIINSPQPQLTGNSLEYKMRPEKANLKSNAMNKIVNDKFTKDNTDKTNKNHKEIIKKLK